MMYSLILKRIILGAIVFVCILGFMSLYTNTSFAAPNLQDAFKGENNQLDKTAGQNGAGYVTADKEVLTSTLGLAIQIVLSFLGVIFLILMIYGGFVWMTARGNEQQAEKAKNILIAATIGFLIVISAYAISWLIMSRLGAETLKPA